MNETPTILVRRIGEHTLPVPSRATPFAAGLDLRNAGPRVTLEPWFGTPSPKPVVPGTFQSHNLVSVVTMQPPWPLVKQIGVGFAFAIPHGYCGLVLGRSGLAFKSGVVAFHIGLIDSDYRGEIAVSLVNHGMAPFTIESGDRIAQLVIAPVSLASCEEGDLDETTRGAGGFGSTGVK